ADVDVLELEAELQLGRAAPPRQIDADAVVVRAAGRAIDEQLEDRLGHPDAAQPHTDAVLWLVGLGAEAESLTSRIRGQLATVRLVWRSRRALCLVIIERRPRRGRSLDRGPNGPNQQDQAKRRRG